MAKTRCDEQELLDAVKSCEVAYSRRRCDKRIKGHKLNVREKKEAYVGELMRSFAGHIGSTELNNFIALMVPSTSSVVPSSVTDDPAKVRSFILELVDGCEAEIINGQHRDEGIRRACVDFIRHAEDLKAQLEETMDDEETKEKLEQEWKKADDVVADACSWGVVIYAEGECLRV
jgi:hypothetical protein